VTHAEHYSATQLLMAEHCGQQYRFRYVDGLKRPPGAALIRGSAVHQTHRRSLMAKSETGELLTPDESAALVSDDVTAAFAGEVEFAADDNPAVVAGETKDAAIALALCDRSDILPHITPVAIEKKVTVNVAGLRPIIGYVDVEDSDGVVRELKTTGQSGRVSQAVADSLEQITVYAMAAMQERQSSEPVQAALDGLVNLKGGPKAVIRQTVRVKAQVQVVLNRFAALQNMLDKGVFVPAALDWWGCSEKWCGYWHVCPYASHPVTVPVG